MTEETSRRAEIERLARKLCRTASTLDPDTLYVPGEPYRVRGGYIVHVSQLRPLWTDFLAEAIVAYDEIESARSSGPAPEAGGKPDTFDFPEGPSAEDVEAARSWREKQGLA